MKALPLLWAVVWVLISVGMLQVGKQVTKGIEKQGKED